MKQNLLMVILSSLLPLSMLAENISFADANVKAICVANWDTNGDGELSKAEAAAVTDLGQVFKYNYSITSFDELQYFVGLAKISNGAFQNCSKLESVQIPNAVRVVGDMAFLGCHLSTINIPSSVTTLGELCFAYNNITYGFIPQNVTNIKDNPFGGCRQLESIRVASANPNYDSRNNSNAIIDKSNNKLQGGCMNTIIPNGIEHIGKFAFIRCEQLSSVTFPNSVKTIERSAFYGCYQLTSLSISNSIQSIANEAFSNCDNLNNIIVAIDNPYYDSRNGCNAIIETSSNTLLFGSNTTVIPNDITAIGPEAFSGRTQLKAIRIPPSVSSIGMAAFYYCTNLTSIEIPASVRTIEMSTFMGCDNLQTVSLPSSIETINKYAFHGCRNIKKFYCHPASVPETHSEAFQPSYLTTASLYVPKSVINAYKSIEPWNYFYEILPLEDEPVIPDNLNNIHVFGITITEKMFDLSNPVSLYLTWSEFSRDVLMDALKMSASQFDSYYWADCMEGGTVANQDVGYVTPNSYYETFNGINGYRLKVYNFGTDIFGNNGVPPTQGGAQFETSNAFENKELGTGWYFPNSAGQGNHEIVWILSKEEADFLTLNRNNSVKVSRWICFKAKNESAPYGNVWVKLTLSIRRMPTGIISTKAETTDVIYDIKGQKIIRSYNDNIKPDIPKGIYIVNGKKLVINN